MSQYELIIDDDNDHSPKLLLIKLFVYLNPCTETIKLIPQNNLEFNLSVFGMIIAIFMLFVHHLPPLQIFYF